MNSFENNPVDLDNLPKWETLSFHGISKKYRVYILTNTVLIWICALVILAVVVLTSDDDKRMETSIWIATAASWTVLLVLYLVFNLISFRRRGYAVRKHDVLYRAGVFSQYTLVIPIKHIQHIKVKTSVLSRLLGLVSVELFTAGAGKDMQIAGLENQHAMALQQHLSERVAAIEQENPSEDA